MPNTPVSQHHSTAPGPPSAMAVDTPMMFPVPMVAASAVASAPNWLTSPSLPLSGVTLSRIALKVCRCTKCSRTVKNTWVPNSITSMGTPHKKSLHAFTTWVRVCMGGFLLANTAAPACSRAANILQKYTTSPPRLQGVRRTR